MTIKTMEEKNLTQKESLELITKMIRETRSNLEHNGGRIYLLWGYLCLVVSVVIYFLLAKTGDYRVQWLWFAIPSYRLSCNDLFDQKTRKESCYIYWSGYRQHLDNHRHCCWAAVSIYVGGLQGFPNSVCNSHVDKCGGGYQRPGD